MDILRCFQNAIRLMPLHLAAVFTALFAITAHAQQKEIKIAAGEVAILGYGSLVNETSMMMTLKRCYESPMSDVTLKGYRRTLNAVMPNFTAKMNVAGLDRNFKPVFYQEGAGHKDFPDGVAYYNMEPSKDQSMSATLFVVKLSEMKGFNEREAIYKPLKIDPKLLDVKITGGDVYAYVADPRFYPQNFAKTFPGHVGKIAIRKSYLEIVDNALQTKPSSYQKNFNLVPTQLTSFSDQKVGGQNQFNYNFNPSSCRIAAKQPGPTEFKVSEMAAAK